jgi:predicted AAA+ superfamily ATPase
MTRMKRIYLTPIQEYLDKKIILITGPRQCGKTTLTQMFRGGIQYLSFDNQEHRQIYREKSWDRKKDIIIFDELHKMRNWKRWLKGIVDVEGNRPNLVVTGSAKLDTYKKVGDSLAGRYFRYRLHPFDIRELANLNYKQSKENIMTKLLDIGGFPEPFLDGSAKFYNLWKKTHLDIILRQDLITQEYVKDIRSIEILIDLLRERVGSPVSYLSLSEDLQCSDKTVKRWLRILEDMYVVFKLTPFHKNIARSNLKQPKYYFYDTGQVKNDAGMRLENLVACSLLKECHFRQDFWGEDWDLHYLRKKDGIEIDFLISYDTNAKFMLEVKLSETSLTRNFSRFEKDLPGVEKIQLVKNLVTEKTFPNGSEIRRVDNWLCSW